MATSALMKMVLKNILEYCDKYGMFVVGFDLKDLTFFSSLLCSPS